MKKLILSVFLVMAVLAALALSLTACGASNADKVDENLGKECEKFECQRRIIALNAITDKPILDVEGRCSIEKSGALSGRQDTLTLICKQGPDEYRKHFVGLADNITWSSYQEEPLDVSEYRTKFIIRPEAIVPDLDLVTGDGG